MYSNNLSTIATISSLIISDFMPHCFCCNNIFNLLHRSSGSVDKNLVFETPKAETIIPGDLGHFLSVRSRVYLLPVAFTSNYLSFANSYNNFLSDKLAGPTIYFC